MSILGDIFGGSDSSADIKRLMEENKALYGDLKAPDYAEYIPELYDTESANAQTIQDDPLLRSRQEQLLNDMAGLSEKGLTAADEAAFAKARGEGNQMAKAGMASAIQDAQNRGVGGSGLEFALREMANQGGAQRAQEAGLDQAATSAKNRVLYNQAYGDELSKVRNQDYTRDAANTNIINDFNMANTQGRNAATAANTQAKNQGQQYNNTMKTQAYNDQLAKINGMTGANQGIANTYAAHDAAENSDRNALLGIGATLGAGAMKKWG